jgi:hypothetical protein
MPEFFKATENPIKSLPKEDFLPHLPPVVNRLQRSIEL